MPEEALQTEQVHSFSQRPSSKRSSAHVKCDMHAGLTAEASHERGAAGRCKRKDSAA